MTFWTQFSALLDEIEAGRRGFVSLPDLRKQFGPDFTTNTIRHYIAKNRPNMSIDKHGRYGWCVSRRTSNV